MSSVCSTSSTYSFSTTFFKEDQPWSIVRRHRPLSRKLGTPFFRWIGFSKRRGSSRGGGSEGVETGEGVDWCSPICLSRSRIRSEEWSAFCRYSAIVLLYQTFAVPNDKPATGIT